MRKALPLAVAGLALAALVTAAPAGARPASSAPVTRPGNVGGWVSKAAKVGTAPASQRVSIAVHLKPRNADQLAALATAVATPGSAQYGKYLTTDQWRAQFAPAPADVAAVQSFLTSAGFTVTETAPSGIYVAATGTVGKVRSAFKVNQDLYRLGSRTVRANSQAPSLPASVAGVVQSVSGLDEAADTKVPTYRRETGTAGPAAAAARTAKPSKVTPPPVAANLPGAFCDTYWGDRTTSVTPAAAPFASVLPFMNCGYTPQQIQAAYGATASSTAGSGVTVAITDAYASPTMFDDANRYAANHGLPALTSATYAEDVPAGIYGVDPAEPCDPQGWWGEESLDVAAVHGMAPGAKILYVGSRDCDLSLTLALFKTIDTAAAQVITNSWSENGEFDSPDVVAAYDTAFQEAATLGISILFSSGDDGDLSQLNGVVSGAWPATSAWATGVGGTSLGLLDATGKKKEWGWGTYRASLTGTVVAPDGSTIANTGSGAYSFYSGAGGGASLVELQPAYQAGVVPAWLSGQTWAASGERIVFGTPHRVSPDISLDADPYTGYLVGESFTIAGDPVADSGCTATGPTVEYCEIGFGGTSLASPLLAGVLARVDEARAAKARPPVGFANPWLYGLKSGSNQTYPILDVVPPTKPTAVVRTYLGNPNRARIVSINATVEPFCRKGICLGGDDLFLTTAKAYDDVTGLGVPNLPALLKTATS